MYIYFLLLAIKQTTKSSPNLARFGPMLPSTSSLTRSLDICSHVAKTARKRGKPWRLGTFKGDGGWIQRRKHVFQIKVERMGFCFADFFWGGC